MGNEFMNLSINANGFSNVQNTAAGHKAEQANKQGKSAFFAGSPVLTTKNQIEQRKKMAQKSALKLVKDAWDNDQAVEKTVASQRQRYAELDAQRTEAKKALAGYEDQEKTLKEQCNVADDSKEQQDLNRYADACREECSKEQEIYIQLMDLFSKGRTGNPSEEEKNAIRNEMKELQKKTDSLRLISSQKEIEIMQQTPKGTVWMDKLLGQCKQSKYMENYPYKEDLIALYNKLSDNEKNSQAGKEITVCLYPPVTVKEGDEMADTDLYDLQGNIHHLADYKGKYLLVDFWSRGCGPCMMALPEMKEISETWKDKVTVISLSTDTEKGWKEISKTKDMSWVNLNDFGGMSGLAAKYNVRGIPHYVIISPEGIILHSWSGYGKGLLKRKLNKWVNKSDRVMSVKKEGNTTIVDFPIEKSSNTETVEINRIELTGSETIFHMKAFNSPGYWVSIGKDTFLKTEDGTHYPLTSADGITPDERFTMPESGEYSFKLHFPALPAGTKTVDFIEGDCDSCFKIVGLSLTQE